MNGADIKKEYEPTNLQNTTNFQSSCPQMNPFLFHQMYLQNPSLFQNPISQMTNSANSFSNALLNLPPWQFKKHNAATINSPIESSLEEHYGSTSSSPSSPSHLHDSFEPCVGDQKSIKRTYKTDGTKTRKSGFQAGVTVGYTYDAFFISDGRSKRRKLNGKTPNNPKTIDEFNTASSASSSSESSVLLSPPGSTNQTANSVSLLQVTNEENSLKNSRYTCFECGKNYATSSNLSRHKQTHRSLDSKLAKKCPHCGKAYVSMPALSMHILTHDLKHRCDICGKAFSRPWLLQGHRRAHTGEKPYGCAHCGRAFADRSNLRAHMQIHSQMKQFECKVCHKGFALKSYLNKHMEFSCNDKLAKEFNTTGLEHQPIEEDKTEPKSTKSSNLPLAMSIAALVGDDV